MSNAKKRNRRGENIDLDITVNEAILMLVGIRLMNELVESIQIRTSEESLEDLIEKLEDTLGEHNTNMSDEIVEELINSFLPEVQISDLDNANYNYPMYSVDDKLPVIEKAIEKKRTLEIEYYSMAREDVNQRFIEPYALQQRDDYQVLIAYCRWREDIRLFRVDRIKSVQEMEEVFDTPSHFHSQDYLNEEYI